MSFTEKRLCNPTQLTTSGQTLYTVPSSKTAIIKQIVVTNVTASAVTFSLYIGSAATPNALFNATSVAANDTIIVNLSQVLNQFESLTALASTNLALNITISGVENDGPLNPLSTYIADGAITTAKLADSSVTTAKIAAGAVVNADIASNAVSQDKLASGLSGTTIVTSSTRSSLIPNPFTGQICYETDTQYLRVWNGASWDYLVARLSSGSTIAGMLAYNGTTKTDGQLYGGTTAPTNTTRLNYDGNLYVNELVAIAITETSSIRYKTNIKDIDNALDVINKMRGVVYDRRDGSSLNETGLIAEELHEIAPSLVKVNEDGIPEAIQYTRIIAYLVEAIKELEQKIDRHG